MTNGEAIQILREEGCGNCSEGYLHPYDCPNNECDVQAALDLAISALSRDRWISVEERLPEENGFYLVKVESPHIPVRAYEYKPDMGWDGNDRLWKGYDGSYVFDHFVTHWMPLPEPPKEET